MNDAKFSMQAVYVTKDDRCSQVPSSSAREPGTAYIVDTQLVQHLFLDRQLPSHPKWRDSPLQIPLLKRRHFAQACLVFVSEHGPRRQYLDGVFKAEPHLHLDLVQTAGPQEGVSHDLQNEVDVFKQLEVETVETCHLS